MIKRDEQKFKIILLIIIFVASFFNFANYALAIPAFPGAEGFGAESVGGRGGQIIKVTNLNDDGPGSFREAVEANRRHYADGGDNYIYESDEAYLSRLETSGHRIVVFDVSGIINLESDLHITYPYLTIAGQTSPGGILITGYQTTLSAHDVIMRHMRFRVGSHRISDGADPEQLDSFDIWGKGWAPPIEAYNIIIDHCSFSWGVDETITLTGGVTNTTVQWSIISEGLNDAGHPKGHHSKGLLVSSKPNWEIVPATVSLHHNYLAHCEDRMPQISSAENDSTLVDVVNNISYNWLGGLSPYAEGGAKANFVNNYMKQGVNSNDYSYEVAYENAPIPAIPLIYVYNNIGSTRLSQSDPQWNVGVGWQNELLNEDYRKNDKWSTPAITTTLMSYAYALEVLDDVGANKPVRDSVDTRVINDFSANTGSIIDNIVYPDDYPTFSTPAPPADTDNDGMSDLWEVNNGLIVGTNDSAGDLDGDGYTNIEEYLHYLAGDQDIVGIRADVDQNSIINSTDAMLTLRNSLGLDMSGTDWQGSSNTGDVNCDGDSNSTDAMLILRHSLGLGMGNTNWCIE